MKNECFEPGLIQAFTDGELDSVASERVLKHVSACADCAAMLSECEEESSFAFSLLDEELNVLVPTERLRTKVFDRIGQIESERRTGYFGNLASGLAGLFNFGTPGLSVAAAVLVIFGMLAIGFSVLRGPDTGSSVADAGQPVVREEAARPVESVPVGPQLAAPEAVEVSGEDSAVGAGSLREPARASDAVYRITREPVRTPDSVSVAAAPAESSFASEDSFIQTISTLDRTVETGKDMLSPSERVSFERDLAVVDNAIVKMRDEVRRNPDNQAAREVLKASYQNKVDLLNSVAEKTELMASLQ